MLVSKKMKKIIMYGVLIFALVLSFGLSTEVSAKTNAYINHKTVSIKQGESITLKVLNNKKSVKWTSTNKKVATVKKGKVTAKNIGNTTIKAKFDGKILTCKVTVTGGNNKTLVVYFSRTGNTRPLAKYAKEYLNADIFEIEAAVPYSDADIAYYTDCRADKEQNDKKARPEIKNKVNNMAQYDTIVLAYPIWHGQAPRIIDTFMESYDFSGKTIVPFCTSASSGIGSSATALQDLVASDVKWKSGKRFAIGSSKKDITDWLDGLGLKPDKS